WELPRGWQSATLTGPDGYEVRSVTFSPDGKLLAAAHYTNRFRERPQMIVIWDLVTRAERGRVQDRNQQCYPIAFSPDGKTIAAGGVSDRHVVKVWEVA